MTDEGYQALGIEAGSISSISWTSGNGIWLATNDGDLAQVNPADGGTVRYAADAGALASVVALEDGRVLAANHLGGFLRLQEGQWSNLTAPPLGQRLFKSPGDEAYAFGLAGSWRLDGNQWSPVGELIGPPAGVTAAQVYAGFAPADGEVWLAGTGGRIQRLSPSPLRFGDLEGVGSGHLSASAPDNVWVTSGRALRRWDGEGWARYEEDGWPSWTAVWTAGPQEVWALSAQSCRSLRWRRLDPPPAPFREWAAVHGVAGGGVWAVGRPGRRRAGTGRFGSRFPPEPPPTCTR